MEIHFYYDWYSYPSNIHVLYTYEQTEYSIEKHYSNIHTTSLANLSFDLIDNGYDKIFIHKTDCEFNSLILQVYPGMKGVNRGEIRREHNILKMLLSGALNELFKKENYEETI